jgi:hypothetical protein
MEESTSDNDYCAECYTELYYLSKKNQNKT